MLKGIEKNFRDNYSNLLSLKRKDQLKTKEDVTVTEAFELYMLKNFHKIKLNELTSKMLKFWEKDFEQSIGEHLEFLQKNLENQNNYSHRFSEILQKMDIFDSDESEEQNHENHENDQKNTPNDDQEDNNEDKDDKNKTSTGSDDVIYMGGNKKPKDEYDYYPLKRVREFYEIMLKYKNGNNGIWRPPKRDCW